VRAEIAESLTDLAAEQSTPFMPAGGKSLRDVFDESQFDPDAIAGILRQKNQDALGTLTDKQIMDRMVPTEVFDDLKAMWDRSTLNDRGGNKMLELYDSMTNLFKVGVLTWPARYFRDLVSGQVRNAEMGLFSFGGVSDATSLMMGKTVKGAKEIPAVQEYAATTKFDLTSESRDRVVSEIGTVVAGRDEQVAAVALLDAHARMWSENTGRPAEELFAKLSFKQADDATQIPKGALLQQARKKVESTPEFQSWFKGSKVVDDAGQPLVVYHGTRHGELGADKARAFNDRIRSKKQAISEYEKNASNYKAQKKSLIEQRSQVSRELSDLQKQQDRLMWSRPESLQPQIDAKRKLYEEINAKLDAIPSKPTIDLYDLKEFPRSEDPYFNTLRFGENDEGYLSAGTYFTKSAKVASDYAMGGSVLPVYINLKNPFVHGVSDAGQVEKLANELYEIGSMQLRNARAGVEEYSRLRATSRRDALEKLGYDGEIFDSATAGSRKGLADSEIVAFYPSQIKSATGNVGAFDPNNPSIMRQMGSSGVKGAIEFAQGGNAIISVLKNAGDISTVSHELGHFFRRSLAESAPSLLRDAEQALGVSGGNWNRQAEEAFASGFERYLRDGKAPNNALQSVFQKFSNWMSTIYRSIVGTPLQDDIDPQLRSVFDQMLTSKKAVSLSDEQATEALRRMYAEQGPTFIERTDIAGTDVPAQQGLEALLTRMPGRSSDSLGSRISDLASTFAGRKEGTTRNPFDIRGVMDLKTGSLRNETKFGPAAAGDILGEVTDTSNRLVGFMTQIRKGVSADDAMRNVNSAQINYNPSNYTPAERHLKRIFPFYSFARGNFMHMANELMQRPGGRTAQVIRAMNRAHSPDEATPDYVAGTASIPLGQKPDGSRSYITGLGLMNEPFLQNFGGGARGMMLNQISAMNPLIKAPLEEAFGKSAFQDRDIRDLDPVIGRTLSNILQLSQNPSAALTGGETESVRPVRIPGAALLEPMIANSPLARAATTVRQLTDPRKSAGNKALNLLTGARMTDISPAAQEAIMRERLSQLMRSEGAKEFVRTYFQQDSPEFGNLPINEQQQLMAMQAYMNYLAQLSKDRADARKQGERSPKRRSLLRQLGL
jgi:hypothetical protein